MMATKVEQLRTQPLPRYMHLNVQAHMVEANVELPDQEAMTRLVIQT